MQLFVQVTLLFQKLWSSYDLRYKVTPLHNRNPPLQLTIAAVIILIISVNNHLIFFKFPLLYIH
jgi:hypothetical protein